MVLFRWIVELIAFNGYNAIWVVVGLGVISQKTEKNTLNFEGKAW